VVYVLAPSWALVVITHPRIETTTKQLDKDTKEPNEALSRQIKIQLITHLMNFAAKLIFNCIWDLKFVDRSTSQNSFCLRRKSV